MGIRRPLSRGLLVGLLVSLLAACSAPAAERPASRPAGEPAPASQPQAPTAPKVLTIGITGSILALSLAGQSTPTGGGFRLSEIHSDGLITSDTHTRRPIGRLAERAPSVEDGSVSLLPDGRMRVAFTLRPGVTWHDGTPFTAQDLVFSYQLAGPDGIPNPFNETLNLMASVEAPDERTFVVYYKSPYYLGAGLGTPEFWPLPRHLLQPAYERYLATRNPDDVLQHRYWTTEYVHLGAFRLTRFEPGESLSFAAYDRYFLGRPKIDTIHIRIFGDENTLLTNLLAGTADMVPEFALRGARGAQLKDSWERNGQGTVHVKGSALYNLAPQYRPGVQTEPANLDPRVRRALLHALDREAISDGVNGGNPQLAAWSLLPASDPAYEVVKDGLRPFTYDPDRARALLSEAGWAPGPDGVLRHSSDGRPYQTHLQGTEAAISGIAPYWRAIGVQTDEFLVPQARQGDRELRALYPGWDATGTDILTLMSQRPATAENRWVGGRAGYDDPRAQRLVHAFESSISERDQAQAMRAIHEFFVTELPSLPVYYNAIYIGVRKGVRAFDDIDGGGSFDPYGSHYRNAYLWDIQ